MVWAEFVNQDDTYFSVSAQFSLSTHPLQLTRRGRVLLALWARSPFKVFSAYY